MVEIIQPGFEGSGPGGGQTLHDVSLESLTTANSLYSMSSAVPVEFQTSGGGHLLYLDEANSRIGLGTTTPASLLSFASGTTRALGIVMGDHAIYRSGANTFMFEGPTSATSPTWTFKASPTNSTAAVITANTGGGNACFGGSATNGTELRVNSTVVAWLRNNSLIVNNGTTNPTNTLDVKGNASIGAFTGVNSAPSNSLIVSGLIGAGLAAPTAYLHLKAGTATASTSPIKLNSGTLNTTAETGAMEYNGTNLSFVPTGTLRENIHTGGRGNITLTAGTTTTITDGTAKTTSTILISPTSLAAISLQPYVSTKNNGSFVITTLAAAGTETLDYLIVN